MEDTKSINRMWNALEQNQQVPENIDLHYLSGLSLEDQERLELIWSRLPDPIRQKLIHELVEIAEADYEMDFAFLFRLALNDPDPEIRATAIEGLWEDEDVRLVTPLTRHLLTDTDLQVRIAAAQTLARFILLGELEKIRSRPFEVACQALIQAFYRRGENLEVRRRALESLAYASLSEVPRMIEESYAEGEEPLRISAVFAMGRSADRRRWGDIVRQELHNSNPNMRYEAARACGELEIKEAIRELIELVDDVDPEVQEAAIWALGQIGGDAARRTLEKYASSDNEILKEAALDALQELEFYHGESSSLFPSPARPGRPKAKTSFWQADEEESPEDLDEDFDLIDEDVNADISLDDDDDDDDDEGNDL